MNAYIEAVDGDTLLKFKKFPAEEGGDEISASQNFIYVFSGAIGK